MTIQAKVIADSVAAHGGRITTLQLRYPRFIHAEFLTHRNFSRNASSSRAIPTAALIEQVRTNPAMPVHWGKNQPGMQAREELASEWERDQVKEHWLAAASKAAATAQSMLTIGAHKQIVNRILEPFLHIDVVVTSTDFTNFFALRDHPDAQPEMQELARAMRRAIDESIPEQLGDDDWHLPYVFANEIEAAVDGPLSNDQPEDWDLLLKLSTARCARVSYLKHDQSAPSIHDDLRLYGRLVGSEPRHASPCEHQATPFADPKQRSRNFVGWLQYRELVEQG